MEGLKTKIWVVDDEYDLAILISMLLEGLGFQVETYTDARVALEILRSTRDHPTLIVSDGQMPHINGLDFLDESKRLNPAIRTILVSGSVSPKEIADHSFTPDRFLQKPFKFDELEESIKILTASEKSYIKNHTSVTENRL